MVFTDFDLIGKLGVGICIFAVWFTVAVLVWGHWKGLDSNGAPLLFDNKDGALWLGIQLTGVVICLAIVFLL